MTTDTYTQNSTVSRLVSSASAASSTASSTASNTTRPKASPSELQVSSRSAAPTTAELSAIQDVKATSATDLDVAAISNSTPIHQCVREELREYMDVLNGETPSDLHRLVMQQVESALFGFVMEECRGNQSKASAWLGISRGTLRTRLAALGLR